MKLKWTTGRVIGCLVGSVIIVLFGIYFSVAFSYKECFFPETTINGVDFGKASATAVEKELEKELEHYTLEVWGRDLTTGESTVLFNLTAGDIDLFVEMEHEDVEQLIGRQKQFLWPVYLNKKIEYTLAGTVSYNEDKLAEFLNKQEPFHEDFTVLPKDAYIKGYSEEEKCFVVEPEVQGTRLDEKQALEVIAAALMENAETVNLEEKGCYLEPKVLASDEQLQTNLAQANKWIATDVTYDWNSNEVKLTGDVIKDWIALKDGVLVLDKTAVAAFVNENAAEYDTYGKSRSFLTSLGYELTLPSGAFGWRTDCEEETGALLELIDSGSVCNREPVYACTAPWKGVNDIGNSYVEADLTHQHLYLYQKGVLVLESDFVSGDMSKNYNTPEGVFGLTYKTTNATLRGGDYAEHVSYWMPYHGNYGMHDATWRTEFGGNIYQDNGSHGCINLPLEKAGEIYQQISEGFPVICYYYPPGMLPEPEIYDFNDDEDD